MIRKNNLPVHSFMAIGHFLCIIDHNYFSVDCHLEMGEHTCKYRLQ